MSDLERQGVMVNATPPSPDTFVKPERYYASALQNATEVVELTDRHGVVHSWMFLPSRNTWPTWHINRPAPTPGCACAACHRPRCCRTWAVPVESVVTGEHLAWICPVCLEAVAA